MRDAAKLGRTLNVRPGLRRFDATCRWVKTGAGVAAVPRASVPRADIRAIP